MAISSIPQGPFIPLPTIHTSLCRDSKYIWNSKSHYTYDFRFKKETPDIIVKWLRTNMGTRGQGWDFMLNSGAGTVTVEIWDNKLQFMYEMWKQ